MGGVGGRVVTEEVKQKSRNKGMPTFSDLQWDPQADREHSAGLECDSPSTFPFLPDKIPNGKH